MKRRKDPDGENTDEERREGNTRWSRKKSGSGRWEQRSGNGVVVTDVGASLPFKSTPAISPSSIPPGLSSSPYLQQLRKLAFKALNLGTSIPELMDHVSGKFLVMPTTYSWDEECESVMTVLFALLYHPSAFTHRFAEDITLEFIRRWTADNEASGLSRIADFITNDKKYTNFATFLLLLGNHFPQEIHSKYLKDCLKWGPYWSQNFGSPPEWLFEVSGCQESMMMVRRLLFISAMMLKGELWNIETITEKEGMTSFFLACRLYKTSDYHETMATLQQIEVEKCSNDLQGWIQWMNGLCMLHLEKPHIALVKLQAAVDTCDSCIPAIFNISQVFNQLGIDTAEMETLSLLPVSGEYWKPYSVMNLESSLLRLHQPPLESLSCQALYLLAARSLQHKMFAKSCNHFSDLVKKLEAVDLHLYETSKTLFQLEDHIPNIPSYDHIIFLQSLAYFLNDDFEASVNSLSNIDEKDIKDFSYYEDHEDERLSCIVLATAYLIKSEALGKLDNIDEALQESMRLERALSFVRGTSSTGWEICILMARTLVYQTISSFHNLKNNHQSYSHYKRLASQSLRLLPKNRSLPDWGNLSLSSKLIVDNIFSFLNGNLSEVL